MWTVKVGGRWVRWKTWIWGSEDEEEEEEGLVAVVAVVVVDDIPIYLACWGFCIEEKN